MQLASPVYGVRCVRPQVPKRTRMSDLTVEFRYNANSVFALLLADTTAV